MYHFFRVDGRNCQGQAPSDRRSRGKPHNTEKVIYFLLLERKWRKPAHEDDSGISQGDIDTGIQSEDAPKKRTDTRRLNGNSDFDLGQISKGSPVTARKKFR
ncbi:hypothetical protein QAD02_008278 [Eretmocerus hayati]|uniref:Uncharacterized protein n=1 Tax=Eretmocerus hayati TaxID=131215 RepID=A0ACC2N6U8_9HYME|nr:hypothetical protein QAD02_008278 [Eretmocerus hayati]